MEFFKQKLKFREKQESQLQLKKLSLQITQYARKNKDLSRNIK